MSEEQKPAPKVLHVPADATPLPEDAVYGLFESAFGTDVYGDKAPEEIRMPFKKFQALMVTLDAANQNVGRLRHWVANAGGHMKKPNAECSVLFLAASAAVDLMLGSLEEFDQAQSLLTIAVNEVALSRAGKLDLDMAAWAQRERDIQAAKPMLAGRPIYDAKLGPLQNAAVQGPLKTSAPTGERGGIAPDGGEK